MILGVKRISFGVTNMAHSIAFYRDLLGYRKVVLDYTGMEPIRCRLMGRTVNMRVVILEHERDGSQVELVKTLPYADRVSHSPRPIVPEAQKWGIIGPVEACFSANVNRVYIELTSRGIKYVCPPTYWHVPPDPRSWRVVSPGENGAYYSYILDPDGALVELAGSAALKEYEDFTGVMGFSHVAVGVNDINRSLDFYQNTLGLNKLRFLVEGPMELMRPVTGELVAAKLAMVSTESGEPGKPRQPGVEIVQIIPPHPYMVKPIPPEVRWGDIGETSFAFEVKDIEGECQQLAQKGVRFVLDPTYEEKTKTKIAVIADADDIEIGLFERLA